MPFKKQTHVHSYTEGLWVGVLKSVILHYDLNVLFNLVIMPEKMPEEWVWSYCNYARHREMTLCWNALSDVFNE